MTQNEYMKIGLASSILLFCFLMIAGLATMDNIKLKNQLDALTTLNAELRAGIKIITQQTGLPAHDSPLADCIQEAYPDKFLTMEVE